MPEGHIKIEKDLTFKGWVRALRAKAIRDISYY